jgi:hypothetical protein
MRADVNISISHDGARALVCFPVRLNRCIRRLAALKGSTRFFLRRCQLSDHVGSAFDNTRHHRVNEVLLGFWRTQLRGPARQSRH